ncbi:hypothetical protein BP00DRAFT_191043 [Aspergillus indologenus CBS 114.80]|uniref:Uncharacterized protein n=1 Tax=Aspergillus indologenus CBS 114.80 TaxID=1450541 RepID=A0A2V5I1T1_9EURO|nr:hypothetical protein BP00DRAFT_191043 [Aspergillus indologenus CBS 114.80]
MAAEGRVRLRLGLLQPEETVRFFPLATSSNNHIIGAVVHLKGVRSPWRGPNVQVPGGVDQEWIFGWCKHVYESIAMKCSHGAADTPHRRGRSISNLSQLRNTMQETMYRERQPFTSSPWAHGQFYEVVLSLRTRGCWVWSLATSRARTPLHV